jgi:hypothetical protein
MAGALKRAAHAVAPRAKLPGPGSAPLAPSSVSERERAGAQGAAQRGVVEMLPSLPPPMP